MNDHKNESVKRSGTTKIQVLLLEGIHPSAFKAFSDLGYIVEQHTGALSEKELIDHISNVHILGIRSKTQVTRKVLDASKNLLAIGCFCIGTNQVDLDESRKRGIAVFNSPYANSRSVAEMTLANIINLSRRICERNTEMHLSTWMKTATGCKEVRGKTLGIVGYGHIGSSLSVLAEALGMRVVFNDIKQIMPLGSARQCDTFKELLEISDFVSLHVPGGKETQDLISHDEISSMKRGAKLINASRGTVVNIDALSEAISSKHVGGAAVDVFPTEPSANGLNVFMSPLTNLPNVILTPHIGGSTEEAQVSISTEVSRALMSFVQSGVTSGCVNLPELNLKSLVAGTVRIVNIHKNVPGVLRKINKVFADYNIESQESQSLGQIAYMSIDIILSKNQIDKQMSYVQDVLASISEVISIRVLY